MRSELGPEQSKLAIFGNMLIDSEERLLRLQDSFFSFQSPSKYTWFLNFRGSHAQRARKFFEAISDDGVSICFPVLPDSGSWRADSLKILSLMSSEYVLVWLEDHLFMGQQGVLDQVVSEMASEKVHVLSYSFFFGSDTLKSFLSLDGFKLLDAIGVIDYDGASHDQRLRFLRTNGLNASTYLVSLPSIFRSDFFIKVLHSAVSSDSHWPVDAPYDVEQGPDKTAWLPLRVGVPRKELFASIDDDHGQEGYSLISRGRYPNRVSRRITATKLSQRVFSSFGLRLLRRKIWHRVKSITSSLHFW